MNRIVKIIVPFFTAIVALGSCGNDNDDSQYKGILHQPPYAVLTDSIKDEPKNDELYFRRAVLLNSNNLPEPALADFKKAWSLKKDERYAYGVSNLLLTKKADSAILFLNQALQELPESFLLRLTLARSLSAQNKTDEALKACEELLQKNPTQVDVLKMKADLLDRKGNKAAAISTLEKAYNLTPYDVELNYMWALKLAEAKNSRVISLCDSLGRADSGGHHAEPYYYKGIYYSNTGDKAKAFSEFNEAIRHDYTFMDAYIEKGAILYEQKNYAAAYKVFDLAASISQQFAAAYYWRGKCEEATGQKNEAKLDYTRAFALDNTFTEAKEAADKLK